MKYSIIILAVVFLFGFTLISSDENIKKGESFNVKINDSTEITIVQAISKSTNQPVYYYSELMVPACNTGECKLIQMTMYWDVFGNYFKYLVPKNYPLTKVGHSEFKSKEYVLLHKILNDTTSEFKGLKVKDLTEAQASDKFADASSGASFKFVKEKSSIKGAIKTCHTLWHIANGSAQDRIAEKTEAFYKSNMKPEFNKGKVEETITKISNQDLIQTQFYINDIKNKDFDKKQFSKALKSTYTKGQLIDKTILLSNFCWKKGIKAKKLQKAISPDVFYKE